MSNYLLQRDDVYHFRMIIPVDVRAAFGTSKIQRSLRTKNKREAKHLAEGAAYLVHKKIQAARASTKQTAIDGIARYGQDIRAWEKEIRATMPDNAPEVVKALHRGVQTVKDTQPPEIYEAFIEAYEAKGLRVDKHVDQFLLQDETNSKTKHQKKTSILRLAATFKHWPSVDSTEVGEWLKILKSAQGLELSRKTKQRLLSDCRSYWQYVKKVEKWSSPTLCPLDDVDLPKPSKNRSDAPTTAKRKEFETNEIVKLAKVARAEGDHCLADIIMIAAHTGARIEEICSLKSSDVRMEESVLCFDVVKGKTEAAIRLIPIHSAIAPLVERLKLANPDAFLIKDGSESRHGNRSPVLSKRFTRLRDSLGLPRTKVFHSIRKTVATLLQRAHVPEGTAAELLGHTKQTMTYGLYSGGLDIKQKAEAIEKLPNLITNHEP